MQCTVSFPFAFLAMLATTAVAQTDYERPPINYLVTEVHDPCAELAAKVASGEQKLEFDEQFGYLPSLLAALEIPTSSQSLVFSKTSLQLHRISPRRPRALYFNDTVYVGYCQNGDVLELAATDSQQGVTFYTIEQSPADRPKFVRDKGGCLSCHASSRTQNVPGYLVRSVFADAAGRPQLGSGSFTTDVTSDFRDRWGGWYVSGTHGAMRHMGNTISTDDEANFDRQSGANVKDLSSYFSTDNYLTPHSDIVALMVLEHQTQMHNAIAAANYETRMALHQSFEMNEVLERPEDHISDIARRRMDAAADTVVRHLLFCDEFPLTDRVTGLTTFADDFVARGNRDSKGRSLRDFNLETRLFEYPCSYLIDSDAFAGLPGEVHELILDKLTEVLEDSNQRPGFEHLSQRSRQDILEILRETSVIPPYRQARQTHHRHTGDQAN